jgi:hypothetical protein
MTRPDGAYRQQLTLFTLSRQRSDVDRTRAGKRQLALVAWRRRRSKIIRACEALVTTATCNLLKPHYHFSNTLEKK